MMAVYQTYICDRCEKDVPDTEVKILNGRPVGEDESLIIYITKKDKLGYYQPLVLCPACWKRVIRQIRKTLNLPDPEVNNEQK